MTVYVTDMEAYRASRGLLNAVWRERMGRHYPAMALLGVIAARRRRRHGGDRGDRGTSAAIPR